MSPPNPADLTAFTWQRHPEAEQLVRDLVDSVVTRMPEAATLAQRMRDETGTRFIDWIDHIVVSGFDAPTDMDLLVERLGCAGYRKAETSSLLYDVFENALGVFPRILLTSGAGFEVALKVDSVADFAAAHSISGEIAGEALADYRWLPIANDQATTRLSVVERHGFNSFRVPPMNPETALARLRHLESFRSRRRDFPDDAAAFAHLNSLLDPAISDLGPNLTTDLFFTAEREYWQRRNRAAQFQKARQDKLGLGWANHDHHTYRSSRKHFPALIALWEKLGFTLRERFYAGAQAGWGAQICEHPVCGIVTFNDVDLSPDELTADFSHEPLPERHHLGTVGLWCALHGESILQAGMHHLECQFDFDALKQQLEADAGIKVMKPFTDFPHLRQAFTEGERWPVDPKRIDALLAANQITAEQAQTFRTSGAIGSHLENLERNEGFKGFNQTGVSDIIARTDPRLLNTPTHPQ